MKIVDHIAQWWHSINRRRRISVLNPKSGREWYTFVTPIRGVLVICAVMISLFIAMLILVGHTTILEVLPAYRTSAEKSQDRLIASIQRIDSMERVMNDMIIYNDNVALILEGKTPVARTTIISDSVKQAKSFTPANSADSVLRAQMEGKGEYSLKSGAEQESVRNNSITFATPIEGIITEHFDLKQGNYGVRIAATSDAQVMAVEQGLVVHSLWSPETGNLVEILHPDNTITIYKSMSQSIVSKGESVKRGEIIGYNSKSVDNTAEQLFGFEMWSNGKPINPERHIIF